MIIVPHASSTSAHPRARQVASYANNKIPADQFAHELKRQGDMFGTCLIAPEKNSESGGSCITTLKMVYPMDWIYRQIPQDRLMDKETSRNAELGFETNSATKYLILDDLKTAVEDGLLVIQDARILAEMRTFTYADNMGSSRLGHFTNHFDVMMAAAIAWHLRKYARVHEPANKEGEYQHSDYERTGFGE
jgi:hypothetical protein